MLFCPTKKIFEQYECEKSYFLIKIINYYFVFLSKGVVDEDGFVVMENTDIVLLGKDIERPRYVFIKEFVDDGLFIIKKNDNKSNLFKVNYQHEFFKGKDKMLQNIRLYREAVVKMEKGIIEDSRLMSILEKDNKSNLFVCLKDLFFSEKEVKQIPTIRRRNANDTTYGKAVFVGVESVRDVIKKNGIKQNRIEKQIKDIHPEKEILEIIEYWKNLGFKVEGEGTKGYFNTIRALKKLRKGTLYKGTQVEMDNPDIKDVGFELMDIQFAFDNFAKSAFDKNYAPQVGFYKTKLTRMLLKNFLFNEYAAQKSLFVEYVKKEPELLSGLIVDKYPELTKYIRKTWVRRIFRGLDCTFTQKELKDFVELSKKVIIFTELYRVSTLPYGDGRTTDCVDLLFNFAARHFGNNLPMIRPHYLLNNRIWDVTFKLYLEDEGILKKRDSKMDILSKVSKIEKDIYFS
jgi:hypothetical protein